nr:uridine kinase [Arthrobacter sp. 260]
MVGIDGVDGAGKTTFADVLAEYLRLQGQTVARVSLDNFHHRRGLRYRLGPSSPDGFWLDSYDYRSLHERVLDPLAPGGSGWFRPAAHDLLSDAPVTPPCEFAPPGSIVILDGLFLHRDEVVRSWDFSVFLDVPFQVTARRMAVRDGSPADPGHPGMRRYVGGQEIYFALCNPAARATLVIDNTDPESPAVITADAASYVLPSGLTPDG